MRTAHERYVGGSSFVVIAVIAALGCWGCEAVLGAEFGDFQIGDDAASDVGTDSDTFVADGRRGSATPNIDGRNGGDALEERDVTGLADKTADTGASTGGTSGSGGAGTSGGTTGSGGHGPTGGTPGAGGAGATGGAGGAAGNDSAGAGGTGDGPNADAGDRDVRSDVGDVALDVAVDASMSDAGDVSVDAAVDASRDVPRDNGPVVGTCVPGQVNAIGPCGNCGLYLQRCNARGVWDPPFCQQDPGACVPGSTEMRKCSGNGTQVATCTASCTWSLGICIQPECKPGQTETQACSLCGKQTRTCEPTNGGQWGPFSVCTGQGVCAAGQREAGTCGKCGTRSRVCNGACAWGGWSACQGEGPCSPGQVQTEVCLLLFTKRSRVCETTCQWGEWGKCQ